MTKPANVGIEVEGAREVRRALKKLGADVHDMTDVHRAIATAIVPQVAAATRRRSGRLAGSWRVRASTAKAAIGSPLVYAPVQEFGWPHHNITPSHALVGTIEASRSTIAAEYQRAVGQLVAKAQGGG